jgi:hypothetical protein
MDAVLAPGGADRYISCVGAFFLPHLHSTAHVVIYCGDILMKLRERALPNLQSSRFSARKRCGQQSLWRDGEWNGPDS